MLSKRKAAKGREDARRPTPSSARPSPDVPPNMSSPAEFESTTFPTSDASSSTPSCRFPARSLESTEPLWFTTDAQNSSFGGGCPSLLRDSPSVTGTAPRSRPLPKLLFSEWLEPEADRRYNFNVTSTAAVRMCNLDSGLAFGFPGTDGTPSGEVPEASCHFAELKGQLGNDVDLLVEEGLHDLLCGEDLFSRIAVNAHDVIHH